LKKGNLFVAFQNLGDASGFMFCAKDASDHVSAIMGDSVRLADIKSLQVVSPLPGQFRLIRNGKTVDVSSDDSYQYILADVTDNGIYRIEVHIQLDRKFVPWINSNPIYFY